MPNTYYVDSVNGADSNSGLSEGGAFRSLNRIESIRLQPGDQVLFARGSVFHDQLDIRYSGTTDNPIVFGAYGSGAAPTFDGPGKGVSGANTSHIVVQDIRIAHTGDVAFYGSNTTDWTIRNVIIEDTSRTTGYGGISWKNSFGLTIADSTFLGVHGDGIYVTGMNGFSVTGSTFSGLQGANADGIQATDSNDVTITGNSIDMQSSPDSNRGGIAVNRGGTVLIADNELTGGSYGAAVTSHDVAIRDNDISGQTRYSWSAGILVSENSDAVNYVIEGNTIRNGIYAVAITSSSPTVTPLRQNIEIAGNTFDDMNGAGVKVDRPTTGSYHDNIVTGTIVETYFGPSGPGAFEVDTDGPRTYYVDSVHGSDDNAGLSPGGAFRALDRLELVDLQPGDRVLFARGSVFNDQLDIRASGTTEAPIVFGAYGSGELPTFSGPGKGIHGGDTSNIVVENVRIAHTGDVAFYGDGASNWTIRNVVIEDISATTAHGGIFWVNGSGLTVANSTINGVHGDGIYVANVDGLALTGNSIFGVEGASADGIQTTGASHVSITGNYVDMQSSPNSTKSGIMVSRGDTILVADNDVIGGSYGLGITSQNVTIRDNDISGQTQYAWSAGILVGENYAAVNYLIEGNTVADSIYGVALTSSGDATPLRQNIEITGNTFDRMSGAGVKVDRPASGSFHDNTVLNSTREAYLGGRFGYGTFSVTSSAAVLAALPAEQADGLLSGTADADALGGGDGNDTLDGAAGADRLTGGRGNDQIRGGDGGDQAFGDAGDDLLQGGAGHDMVRGGAGSDSLDGGAGNDTLDGGNAFDVLFGGEGADRFFLARPTDGVDLVRDFVSGIDSIAVGAAGFGLAASGALAPSSFASGNGLPAGFQSNEPLFYLETGARELWFDPTGGAANDARLVARFETQAPAAGDFIVV